MPDFHKRIAADKSMPKKLRHWAEMRANGYIWLGEEYFVPRETWGKVVDDSTAESKQTGEAVFDILERKKLELLKTLKPVKLPSMFPSVSNTDSLRGAAAVVSITLFVIIAVILIAALI